MFARQRFQLHASRVLHQLKVQNVRFESTSSSPQRRKEFVSSSRWRRYIYQSQFEFIARWKGKRMLSAVAPVTSSKPNPRPGDFIPITWRTVAFTFAFASAGLYFLYQEKQAQNERAKKVEAERQTAQYGKPKVGGPFTLVDSESGKTVTDKDFLGKYMIIYFGFTHCPDICPDELEKMSLAITKIDSLKGVGEMVVPVFISVDPKRDTPEAVKAYIKEFHPRFVGLTGTQEQVDAVAKAYRIYVSKGDPGVEGDDDYLVDHSIFFFLIDPEGTFADFFGRNATADEVAEKVMKVVREWKKDKQAQRV